MHDDLARLRVALDDAGVMGSHDLGRFVNNTDYFEPSALDDRAAMPVLLAALPTLSEAKAVEAVARHLRRPWARGVAFDALHAGFTRWAAREPRVGWALGDALVTAAQPTNATALLALAVDHQYGWARQMLVHGLWRFRKQAGVTDTLRDLCRDPDVCLHAMSSYRRAVSPQEALFVLEALQEHPDATVRKQAAKQTKKAAKALVASSE